MTFRKWSDSIVEFKKADRTKELPVIDCNYCDDTGFVTSDADDGEGHTMVGAGYPVKCGCQIE